MSEEQEVTAMPSSEEIFASATAPDKPEDQAKEAPEKDSRERDDHGRFAAKQDEPTEPTAVEPKAEEAPAEPPTPEPAPVVEAEKGPGPVPYDRFREIIEQNRQLMNMLQQQRVQQAPVAPPKAEEPVDDVSALLDNPSAYLAKEVDARTAELREQLRVQAQAISRMNAISSHGAETVNSAQAALEAAINEGRMPGPQAQELLRNHPDPYGEIVKWHEAIQDQTDPSRAIARQLESMPEATRAALLAKFGAAPAKEQAPPTSVVKLPPSLTRQTGSPSQPSSGGMGSDEVFRYAIGK